MKIAIIASIGSQNLGDELILKNEIKILEKKYSSIFNIDVEEIEFIVFTYDLKDIFYKKNNIKYREYFPINIKNPKNIFRNIFNFLNFIKTVIISDLIVIGGGGIIYDNELQTVGSPLKQWYFRTKIFKLFRKKVEFFRIGINIKNEENLDLVKRIFSVASNISVRDDYSFNLLKSLQGAKDPCCNLEIKKYLDPVFFDKENFNNPSAFQAASFNTKGSKNLLKGNLKINNLNVQNIKNILQQGGFNPLSLSGKKIGLALRYQKQENYVENILEIIKYFLENKCTIYLIPHSFHKTDDVANDYVFLKSLISPLTPLLKGEENRLNICKTMQESYEIYTNKKIDLNLASRLHSIILSQVYEIDFIAISYSKKTDEVISQLSNQNQDI